MEKWMPEKDANKAEILYRFNYADSWRKPFEEKAIEHYKLYEGYRKEVDEDHAGRSNLHIPRTYEQIDAWRSRVVKTYFSSRPYVDFSPIPTQTELINPELLAQKQQSASIAAALVDMQLVKNNIITKFYDFVTSLLIFPAAIMSIGWRYEKKKVKRKLRVPVLRDNGDGMIDSDGEVAVTEEFDAVLFDDNEIQNVDFFDFWVDPRGQDLDSCRFVFHREWATQEQIEDMLATLKKANNGKIYDADFDALRGGGNGTEEGRWDRLWEIDMAPETQQGYQKDDRLELFEVLHYWEDNRHAIIINRAEMAYDGENPYWRHRKKPFILQSFEPMPNEIYGRSAIHYIQDLQEELNTLRNQRVDNISFALNKMWKVRKGADINENELVSRPFGIIHVDSMDDVEEFKMTDITGSVFNDEAILKQDMEGAIGVPAVVRGADPSRRETATEVVTKTTNSAVRFDVKIMTFQDSCLARLYMLMDLNNQQFIDEPRVVKLFDEAGLTAWRSADPQDLIGEHDYTPGGSATDPSANKETRRSQLNQLMPILLGANIPWVNKEKLIKIWLQSFDIRGIEQIILTPEEMAEQQAQMMQQMMAAQMMAGGGGGQGGGQQQGAGPPNQQSQPGVPQPPTG
jgi:hypothetical protein